jgi:hypothetical protein
MAEEIWIVKTFVILQKTVKLITETALRMPGQLQHQGYMQCATQMKHGVRSEEHNCLYKQMLVHHGIETHGLGASNLEVCWHVFLIPDRT